MKIHYLQHVPFEGPGHIIKWAEANGHGMTSTRMHTNEPLPSIDDFDWLVIMGGPMSIHDEDKYPWLSCEKHFVKEAIKNGKIVLGICLGAQLIADVLGAEVYPGKEKEIGWFPIEKIICDANAELAQLFPHEIDVFHWHGETFDVPVGANKLASSHVCENQAFVYKKKVIGLQFHLESTKESIKTLIANCRNEMVDGPFIQKESAILRSDKKIEAVNDLMEKILNYLAGRK